MHRRTAWSAFLMLGAACAPAKPTTQSAPGPTVFAVPRGSLYVTLSLIPPGAPDYTRISLERGLARFGADSVPLAPGDYVFRDVPIGRYELVVRRIGYIRLADSVSIRDGMLDTVRLSMRIDSGCHIDCAPARRPPS